MLKRMVI